MFTKFVCFSKLKQGNANPNAYCSKRIKKGGAKICHYLQVEAKNFVKLNFTSFFREYIISI